MSMCVCQEMEIEDTGGNKCARIPENLMENDGGRIWYLMRDAENGTAMICGASENDASGQSDIIIWTYACPFCGRDL